ncbi:MAG: ATP-binding protein [Rubripirellula sp.]
MSNIIEYTNTFADVTVQTLVDMFGIETSGRKDIEEVTSVQTERSFIVSLYYTGSVYGEYLLALDEATAAKIIGWEGSITDENREEVREEICDALSETLNTIVGESIVHLQESYPKLTLTAPRIFFGEVRYPQFKTGRTVLNTEVGQIECHFCLDLMRLDLATSYDEAMQNMVEINDQLKKANQNLAEQQAQLVHSEKMASVGVLASGVAHEINNPLFFVDTNITTLTDYIQVIESTFGLYENLASSLQGTTGEWMKDLDSIRSENEVQDIEFVMEDTKELMAETREGISRIKEIVTSLKDFSQAEKVGRIESSINDIAQNTFDLFKSDLPENCELVKNFGELPKVVCNPAEIGQVLAGVFLNASQALSDGGQVTFESIATDSDIVVTFEDTGCGIPEKHIDRIFEPFYSTKPEGEGRGLGLSIAYGIIQKHQGSISISSDEGQGTKVVISIPLVAQLAETE